MTTVAELIEKLKEYPQDMRVVMWNHWGNYKEIKLSEIDNTEINKNQQAVKLS